MGFLMVLTLILVPFALLIVVASKPAENIAGLDKELQVSPSPDADFRDHVSAAAGFPCSREVIHAAIDRLGGLGWFTPLQMSDLKAHTGPLTSDDSASTVRAIAAEIRTPMPPPVGEKLAEMQAKLTEAQELACATTETLAAIEADRDQYIGQVCRLRAELDALRAAKSTGSASNDSDDKFRRLRAVIASELHPDHAPAGSIDRALREAAFKVIWPKVEAVAASESS